MTDLPNNIQALFPWVLSKHSSLGWTPKGAWVGQETFKLNLIADAERPQGTSTDDIRRAVNGLLGNKLIGPLSEKGRGKKEPPAPRPTTTGQAGPKPTRRGTPKASASYASSSKPTGASQLSDAHAPKGRRAARAARAQTQGHMASKAASPVSLWNPADIPAQMHQPGLATVALIQPHQEASSSTASDSIRSQGDTQNRQSQYSPDTTFSLRKDPLDRFGSWNGVPLVEPDWNTPPSSVSRGRSRGTTDSIGLTTKPEIGINWDLEQTPTLDGQLELLGLDDSEDDVSLGAKLGDKEIHDAVLFGAPILLDEEYSERTKKLIPQYGLLGSVLQTKLQDTRIFLNSNNPASFFICGLQGSGKSHTLSTMLENYLIPSPKIGVLRKPLSGLVLHFGEFNSRDAFRPCEAAYLASPDGSFADGRCVRGVTVLVSPSNYPNLKSAYRAIPGVNVQQLKLRSRDLTIQSMLTLMSVDSTSSQPLYMAQVTKVLRDMAALGGDFDYITFTQRLDDVDLIPAQRRMLDQRLELLESFLDLESFDGGCFEDIDSGQQLVIVDLSCPFVDASAACVLFNICIGLFLSTTSPEKLGKVIAVDEAHKYMTDTPASKILTEQLLSIIRQQRHYGARIIIATQEPTISPRLMDLASATIIHRFSSPEWFNTLRKHLSIVNSGGKEAADLFTKITSLKLGEALVFAPSAILTVSTGDSGSEWSGNPEAEDITMLQGGARKGLGVSNAKKMMSEFFKMKVRRRITLDGGATVRSL